MMKGLRKKLAALAVIAIGFGMSLPVSHAGSVARAKFKLPFDSSLGKVALPTGDYELSVDHLGMNGAVHIYHGTQTVATLLAQSFSSYDTQGEKPTLVFVRHDGKTALRALRFPQRGTFYFALPKELQNLSAKQPQLIETISVEVSAD